MTKIIDFDEHEMSMRKIKSNIDKVNDMVAELTDIVIEIETEMQKVIMQDEGKEE